MRLKTTSTLLSGRRDVIVVSSVSCLYGIGNPADLHAASIELQTGDVISRKKLLAALFEAPSTRTKADLARGPFRVTGATPGGHLAYR